MDDVKSVPLVGLMATLPFASAVIFPLCAVTALSVNWIIAGVASPAG